MLSPLLHTDTYNRTMAHLKGGAWNKPETYVFSLRRSPWGYLVVAGVQDILTQITQTKITKAMIDEAEAYAKSASVKYFNREMWDTVLENNGQLTITSHAVPDGTIVLPGDPILRMTGPGELVAHFEAQLHRIFYPTLVATHAHIITDKLGPNRFFEVGLRSAHNAPQHETALRAAYVGGGITHTSSDAAATKSPFVDIGTIGHRYVQAHTSTEAAFRHAIDKLDAVSLLVDLHDPYDGITLAHSLQREFEQTKKTIAIRLDSGDLRAQVHHIFSLYKTFEGASPTRHKIIVEGLSTTAELFAIEESLSNEQKIFVAYGAGGLLLSESKARSSASSAFKLCSVALRPTMKWSGDAGKQSLPGQPTLAITPAGRYIAQVGEYDAKYDQLVLMVKNGTMTKSETLQQMRARTQKQTIPQGTHTLKSPCTLEIIERLRP